MKNIIQLSAFLMIATGIISCGHSDKDNKKQDTSKATVYNIITLQQHSISGTVRLPGVLQPFEFVQVFPKISGFVKEVYVDRGSVVKQGQVLIRLEAPEIEQHVAAAKLQYAQSNANYLMGKDRYMRLLETSSTPGTISPYDLEAARSKMQADSATAQGVYADYRAQMAMQAYLTVTAPFDGVITERNVHPGALVGPGAEGAKPMLVLQQQSKLRLVVNIPEQYSAQVNDGEIVHYHVNALPGQDFTGKVSRSSNSLSNGYRAETIEIDVPNPNNTYKAGMYAEVVLPVSGSASAYVVPVPAVITTTERKYVIAVNDGHAKWIDVSTGNKQSDSTEVFGDLHTGDNIIANPNYRIKNGDAVATH